MNVLEICVDNDRVVVTAKLSLADENAHEVKEAKLLHIAGSTYELKATPELLGYAERTGSMRPASLAFIRNMLNERRATSCL